jgi:hypothetical protein
MNLHIKNARVWGGSQTVERDLYTAKGRIVDQPASDALVVDLEGYTIFPGLINAHDHLELNHYPRSKFREVYDNAHQWGEDMNARLDTEPYKSLRAYPLEDRLFIGGLKNLLCGATTVAHHGPPHKPMFRKDFPVRVLRKYGWAHSLHFNTEQEVIESHRKTPKQRSWFIHLAEGTDEVAASEYGRLKALGCGGNSGFATVLIHCVGLSEADAMDIYNREDFSLGIAWCPTSNFYLLGKTLDYHLHKRFIEHFGIGSDSRLTSEGDLLSELRMVAEICDPEEALWLATQRGAYLITSGGGSLSINPLVPVSFIVLKQKGANAAHDLCNASRCDLALIVKDGIPQIGDPAMMAKFPHVQTVAATLDGVPKAIHIDLARRIHQCTLKEPGLEVDALPTKRFWLI